MSQFLNPRIGPGPASAGPTSISHRSALRAAGLGALPLAAGSVLAACGGGEEPGGVGQTTASGALAKPTRFTVAAAPIPHGRGRRGGLEGGGLGRQGVDPRQSRRSCGPAESSQVNGKAANASKAYIEHYATTVVPKIQPDWKVQKEGVDVMIDVGQKLGHLKDGQVSYEKLVAESARV
ncbi:hypothetical protein [Microtetraspora sp. NBRC 16547]|uniref:hypothetical protein n=1 Tax=Microtetraspora sp. NBRC 16547 TaxID=3030993 RepID=UPI0024A5E930|nr:hypothetical protein [Microtetraspora sp. NBRC 16547]GLW99353.1 hypothetical protein Misp02_34400 [Microtetraspora sp. NBRC 16547]